VVIGGLLAVILGSLLAAFGAVITLVLGRLLRDPRDALAERVRAGTPTFAGIVSLEPVERPAVVARRKA
jgi:hypothetical protein